MFNVGDVVVRKDRKGDNRGLTVLEVAPLYGDWETIWMFRARPEIVPRPVWFHQYPYELLPVKQKYRISRSFGWTTGLRMGDADHFINIHAERLGLTQQEAEDLVRQIAAKAGFEEVR